MVTVYLITGLFLSFRHSGCHEPYFALGIICQREDEICYMVSIRSGHCPYSQHYVYFDIFTVKIFAPVLTVEVKR